MRVCPVFFFFFNDTATTEIYTLSLHDALPISDSRRAYRARLLEYLRAHAAELDADSQRRLAGNPLRVLDSKHPQMQEVIRGAPLLTEHLDPESRSEERRVGKECRSRWSPYH